LTLSTAVDAPTRSSPEELATALPMTVLIRTFNEADRIEKAIASVRGLAREILVIDSGSTDRTVELAKNSGARVLTNPWAGFGPQRFFGETHCKYDLIFSLDADEVVTPALQQEIRRTLQRNNPPKLMIVRKALVIPGQNRLTPFPFCHEQIYIYDRRVARTSPDPHVDRLEVTTEERPERLRELCIHYAFRNWVHASRKFTNGAELAANTLSSRSPTLLKFRLVLEFPFNFFKFYFLRRYFLGGTNGFLLAMITAYGRFIRLAAVYEKTSQQKHYAGEK
jgi:glycosyltransferase involved in cell wall biosynthesis